MNCILFDKDGNFICKSEFDSEVIIGHNMSFLTFSWKEGDNYRSVNIPQSDIILALENQKMEDKPIISYMRQWKEIKP